MEDLKEEVNPCHLIRNGLSGGKDPPTIIFNFCWKKGTYLSFIPSAYSFHLFWWNYTTTSSSLPVTELEGGGRGTISGRCSVGSDEGSGVGTSFFNVNGATAGGFISGENITWSEINFLSMVSVLSSNTSVNIV